MTIIVNGAPHYIDLGTKDSSGRQVLRLAVAYPQHLPKWYLHAEKGEGGVDWFGGGVEALNRYGDKTFSERSKFWSHQTQGWTVANNLGNQCVIHRIIPVDSGPAANLMAWLDLLPGAVDDYERNIDGSYKTVNGQPVLLPDAIPGYMYQWVITVDTTHGQTENWKTRAIREGNMFDPSNPTTRSTQYPMFGWRASSQGEWGNNTGLTIWGMDNRTEAVPERMIEQQRCFPYGMRMVSRDLDIGSVSTLKTKNGDEQIMFTLKPQSYDPATNQDMYLARRYYDGYFETDTRYPVQQPALSDMVIYQNNIDAVLSALYEAEKPYIDANFHDFNASGDNEKYLYNILGGRTLNGFAYRTFVPVVGTVLMERSQLHYAAGGSDGTISLDGLEKGMIADVRRYRDANDIYQDKAGNLESHMYDTGWSLNGKMEMAGFISVRGDTFATFGTFQEGEREFDNSEELSIASAIKARLSNYPESTYFGTPIVRAGIYGGSARIRGSALGNRVSTVMEVIHKRAKYMGASNGAWTSGSAYDQGAPGSVCEILYDFDKLWVPPSTRFRFWDAGLNWWGRLDPQQNFCPAFRTVYSDDTSVLTADTVAMALIFCNRVNDRSWRVHSGTTGVEAPVFLKRIKEFIAGQVQGKLDNRYTVDPVPQITANDALLGYAWHSGINIFADPMRTVAINYTEAFRQSDRPNASTIQATFP